MDEKKLIHEITCLDKVKSEYGGNVYEKLLGLRGGRSPRRPTDRYPKVPPDLPRGRSPCRWDPADAASSPRRIRCGAHAPSLLPDGSAGKAKTVIQKYWNALRGSEDEKK